MNDLQIKYRPYVGGFYTNFLRERTPSVKIVLGTFGSMVLIAMILWLLSWAEIHRDEYVFNTLDSLFGTASMLVAVVVLGATGGLISLWARIGRFSEESEDLKDDPWALVLTGVVKPFVGAAFAVFALCVLQSGLLNSEMDPDNRVALALAVAFLAGFSERFVGDLVSKTEGSA